MPNERLGLRVVRGPNWKWENQDGGEGGLGTVVEIRNKEVIVQWDMGSRPNYRCGLDGNYDLLVYDSGPAGIVHNGVSCDSCNETPVRGIRWKCATCNNFDLCNSCYNEGKHDNNHPFLRIDEDRGQPTNVGRRYGSVRKDVRGFFPGAIVKRGRDWEWGPQDGGIGKTGRMMSFYQWKGTSPLPVARSAATIRWSATGNNNNYRIGFGGKVDLLCETAAKGGHYYKNHLAKLVVGSSSTNNSTTTFSPGDKVVVTHDVATLKRLQDGHGGWNDEMKDAIGKIGKVVETNFKGDVIVTYELPTAMGHHPLLQMLAQLAKDRWIFNPACLKKVETFSVGDKVKVLEDQSLVEKMQHGHGGWVDSMERSLGQIGVVFEVDNDGDVRIRVSGTLWTFSPAALTKNLKSTTGNIDDRGLRGYAFRLEALQLQKVRLELWWQAVHLPGSRQQLTENDEDIVSAAAQGEREKVESILERNRSAANALKSGKSALHLAVQQGHMDIVELLIDHGAGVDQKDSVGQTSLHYAAFENKHECGALLLNNGAELNVQNEKGQTPLHISAEKGHKEFVVMLLENDCLLHTQDKEGDTPLNVAVCEGHPEIFHLLIDAHSSHSVRISPRLNKKGCSSLHIAAAKEKEEFVEIIVRGFPQLINIQKKKEGHEEDGFTALHIAAKNGFTEICRVILDSGQADVELKSTEGYTPLRTASEWRQMAVVKLLLNYGANVNATDIDGDTALHSSIEEHESRMEDAQDNVGVELRPVIPSIKIQFEQPDASAIAIACFLVKEGADLTLMNNKGKTAIDVCEDTSSRDIILYFKPNGQCTADIRHTTGLSVCSICRKEDANVTFSPCGHKIACLDCSKEEQFCPRCSGFVEEKIQIDRCNTEEGEASSLSETYYKCNICVDNQRNVVFQCGHGSCSSCAENLLECHICRKPIKQINPFYP